MKNLRNLAFVAAPLAVAGGAANAAVDAGVTSAITGALADVGIIGAAVLGVIVAVRAFKWARSAL